MANIVPLAAETIAHIGSFPVTNSLLNAWIGAAILIIFTACLRFREVPRGIQNAFEMLVEFLLSFFDQVTNDRKKSRQFLPIIGTFFIFILLSNWLGLLPGTGSIGIWQRVHGELELVPILRPANSDLNLTLAMALISVIGSHIVGIVSIGLFAHLNRFIQVGGIWKALKTFSPIAILTALVEFVVGLIEIIGEMAKVASLSLRLFGNIFAGEVLITVIASLASFFMPLPFMALELLVGLIQATVFAMLSLVYLSVLSSPPHGSEEGHEGDAHAAKAHH